MGRTRDLASEVEIRGAIRLHEPNGESDHHLIEWDYDQLTIVEKIWSDAQWERLPPSERPILAMRVEGLGWTLITVREEVASKEA